MEKKRFLEGDNKRFCVVSRLLCFFVCLLGFMLAKSMKMGWSIKVLLLFG